MRTDWRTTVCGIIAAFCGFVVSTPEFFSPAIVKIAGWVLAGGLAALGIVARDAARKD